MQDETDESLPSVLLPTYFPFISSSFTGEKKCTDKAYPLLLEQGAISTGLLLKDKDLIMTHRTNPIYHQRQHLIKIESKIGEVFADFFLFSITPKIFEKSYQVCNYIE